jgi:hypothetical protein
VIELGVPQMIPQDHIGLQEVPDLALKFADSRLSHVNTAVQDVAPAGSQADHGRSF